MADRDENRSPAFQFYPDIWESHTNRLGDEAYVVFHRILCWMWQHAPDYCSIPADPEHLAVCLGMPCERIARALLEIQNPYCALLLNENDKLISKRLRRERMDQEARSAKAQKGAKARWGKGKGKQPPSKPQAPPEQSTPPPSPSPSPAPPLADEEDQSHGDVADQGPLQDEDEHFAVFWAAYPNPTNRQKTYAMWTLHRCVVHRAKIMAGVERWKTSRDWTKDDGEWIHKAANFLENKLWEEYPQQVPVRQTSKPKPENMQVTIRHRMIVAREMFERGRFTDALTKISTIRDLSVEEFLDAKSVYDKWVEEDKQIEAQGGG